MKRNARKIILFILALFLILSSLCSCSSKKDCFYAYFEDTSFILVYDNKANKLYEVILPLEEILLWGKEAGLESIPVAMRNYVGLKETGFLIGTKDALQTVRDMLDVMGNDRKGENSPDKRIETFAQNIDTLSKKPLSDNMNKLCGLDMAKALEILKNKNPETVFYDAQELFNNEDLNFSQRYFSQWLGQVLGGY